MELSTGVQAGQLKAGPRLYCEGWGDRFSNYLSTYLLKEIVDGGIVHMQHVGTSIVTITCVRYLPVPGSYVVLVSTRWRPLVG